MILITGVIVLVGILLLTYLHTTSKISHWSFRSVIETSQARAFTIRLNKNRPGNIFYLGKNGECSNVIIKSNKLHSITILNTLLKLTNAYKLMVYSVTPEFILCNNIFNLIDDSITSISIEVEPNEVIDNINIIYNYKLQTNNNEPIFGSSIEDVLNGIIIAQPKK